MLQKRERPKSGRRYQECTYSWFVVLFLCFFFLSFFHVLAGSKWFKMVWPLNLNQKRVSETWHLISSDWEFINRDWSSSSHPSINFDSSLSQTQNVFTMTSSDFDLTDHSSNDLIGLWTIIRMNLVFHLLNVWVRTSGRLYKTLYFLRLSVLQILIILF